MDIGNLKTYHGIKINKDRLYKEIINHDTQAQALNELEQLENSLKDVQSAINKEKDDRKKAQRIGGAVGKASGRFVGNRLGPVGKRAGGMVGKKIGGVVGEKIEGFIDFVTGGDTDQSLQRNKNMLEDNINKLNDHNDE